MPQCWSEIGQALLDTYKNKYLTLANTSNPIKHLCFSVPNKTNRFQVPRVVRAVIDEK